MDKNKRDNPDKVMRKFESIETTLWGQIALGLSTEVRSPNFISDYHVSEGAVQQLIIIHLWESFLPLKIGMQILLLQC